MSSPPPLPDALCYEFSRSLEQSFAWSPPDLSVSSKTCSSIVALSPSEIAHLGLNCFESESAPSNLFLARQISSEREHMTREHLSTRNSDTCVPSHSSRRIDELENPHYATRPSDLGIKRYSMNRVMPFRSSGNLRPDDARQHLPPSTDNNNLFSGPSSSSILYSSTSREFSSQSSENIRELAYGERTRTGDGSRRYDASHKQTSSGNNHTLRDPIRDRHRPRSYPGLANEDVPSALDFHINTFPPLSLDSSAGVVGPQDNRTCFLHPYPSDIQLLPSSSTSETFSPLLTLSDRTDIHRQLIYFPSPTFSLSRFPSSLSSPAMRSSEISGDVTMAFPSNWGAEDIIVDMIPISDEYESSPAYETANLGPVQKERFTERIAKLGGKFKRALLNRIRSLRTQNTRNDNHNIHYGCSDIDVSESSALGPPPGLTGQFSSDLAKPLESSNRQSMAVQETSSSQMFPLSEGSSQVNPPKSMKKRFSLSIFARPSSVAIPDEPKKRKQVRPKSMPNLLNQYPTGCSLVEPYDNNKQRPRRVRSKQSKKLSLLFLRNRS